MYPAGNVSQQLMFLAYFLEVSMKKITIIITANDDGEVAVKIDVPTEGTHVVVNDSESDEEDWDDDYDLDDDDDDEGLM